MLRFAAILLFVLSHSSWALPVAGRIRELGQSSPIAGALVELQGSTLSAQSATDGRWSLDLPAGEAVLKVSADNFAPQSFALSVSPVAEGQRLDAGNFSLARVDFEADVVVVHGRRENEAPSRVSLQSKEIRRIAGIGRDPLRALQTLPGVVTPSDFSGQLAVRGGGPQDNAYYLNNVPWPVPFHYGGALSTVHGDLLKDVDFYPAAFPPRWGGVDGAILDAHSRAPKRDQFHGQMDVNLLLSEGLLEGPLGAGAGPADAAGDSTAAQSVPAPKGGWLISGRRSYLELLLAKVGSFTAVPLFWDLSALGDYDLGPEDKLTVTALATDDVLGLEQKPEDVSNKDFAGEFRFHNAFESLGLNWDHKSGDWRSTFTPYAYRSLFENSFGKGYGLSIQPSVLGMREDLRKEAGAHEVGLGWGVQAQRYEVFGYTFRRSSGSGSGFVSLSDAAGITISATAVDNSLYLQDRVTLLEGLRVLGGLRWQQVNQMESSALDPRVNLEWQARPRTVLSAGWGQYSQYPTPRELSQDFGNPDLGFNHTEHVVAGLEQGLGAASSVKVEAYYKTYRDRVVEVADKRIFSNDGSGLARGVELMLRHEVSRRFFGWLSYSYAESQRLGPPSYDWRPYQYDQPHTLTLVGSYDVTPAWSAGLKLNYHSGPLITPVVGRVADSDPNNTAGWLPIYGQPYSERLSDYLRLDIRTDYALRLEGAKVNLYAEVINALNRPNPAGVTYSKDFSQRQTVNNLPLLPYVGLGIEF
jgi:hypothetical protein